jgi:hypothetical protein
LDENPENILYRRNITGNFRQNPYFSAKNAVFIKEIGVVTKLDYGKKINEKSLYYPIGLIGSQLF